MREHAEQHGLVRATGGAHGTDPVRATVPRRSLGLTPANPIVDVGQRSRIRCLRRHTKIQCRHDHTMLSQRFVGRVAVQTISPDPRPTVQFDHNRERSAAARLEETRQQRFVAVPEIFHVFDINGIRRASADSHMRLLLLVGHSICVNLGYTWWASSSRTFGHIEEAVALLASWPYLSIAGLEAVIRSAVVLRQSNPQAFGRPVAACPCRDTVSW